VDRCGVPSGGRLLIAVSGGADSVALLHALARQPRRFRAAHHVAHANHGLRGAESDEDEAFVRALCERLGFELVTQRLAIPVGGKRSGDSLEMAARKHRHRFLASAARQLGVDTICLAHHGDDQVESFLMRLLRGSGGEGLQGMRWNGPSPVDPTIRLVRPLLGCRREELRAFLQAIGEPHREDPSNWDGTIPRNAVRHELLPFLRRFGGAGVEEAILRAAELVGSEAHLTALLADAWTQEHPAGSFPGLHEAIQRVVIREQLRKLEVPSTFGLIEKLRGSTGRSAMAPGGRRIVCDQEGVVKEQPKSRPPFIAPGDSGAVWIHLEGVRGSLRLPDGRNLHWRIVSGGKGWVPRADGKERFDAGIVGKTIGIRHWQPGDRFHPLGAPGGSKLQDLFTNHKVSGVERRQRWLAQVPDGQILWVEGLRPGEAFKVNDKTWQVLELGFESEGCADARSPASCGGPSGPA